MRAFTPRELARNTAGIVRRYPAWLARPRSAPEAVRAYQLATLRKLVAHAAENVPLYREK